MPGLLVILGALVAMVWRVVNDVAAILVRPLLNDIQSTDPNVPLSPGDYADMENRGIIAADGYGAGQSAKSGIGLGDYEILVRNAGTAIPTDVANELWRRGIIGVGTLEEIYQRNRIHSDMWGLLVASAFTPMTPGDAIEAGIKGAVDYQTAQNLFEQAGGVGEEFATLFTAAGNPIGVEQGTALWNHGFIDEAEMERIILHSRINPSFSADAKLLRHKFFSPIQIGRAVASGAATAAQATEWLLADGYPADQVAAVVGGLAGQKSAKHKNLSEAQILDLYESGLFSEAQAAQDLENLGYDAGEVGFILAVYQQKRILAMTQAAVSVIRRQYLDGHIDAAQADGDLNGLGIDPGTRAHFLQIWAITRQAETKTLSMAQVGQAFKKGLIDQQTAEERWLAMGYSAADVPIIASIYGAPPPPGSPAALAGSH